MFSVLPSWLPQNSAQDQDRRADRADAGPLAVARLELVGRRKPALLPRFGPPGERRSRFPDQSDTAADRAVATNPLVASMPSKRADKGVLTVRITGTGHASMRIDTGAGQHPVRPVGQSGVLRVVVPLPGQFAAGLGHARRRRLPVRVPPAPGPLRRQEPAGSTSARRRPCCCRSTRPASSRTSCATWASPASFKTRSNEVHELDGGLKIMIQALTSPTDGPIGDSSLWVEHDGVRVLNQNDARPTDLTTFAELGHVHAHMLQFSGAIWYPMVYELPQAAKTAFGKQKRDRQFDRTWRYIDDLKASHVFPIAGPPCFLDDELWQFNDIFGDEGNIFPDQSVFMREYAKVGGTNGVVLLPGSVSDLTTETRHHDAPDRRRRVLREQDGSPRGDARAQAAGHRGGEGVLAAPRDRRARRAEEAHRAAARGVDLPGQGRRRAGPVRPGQLRRRVGRVDRGRLPGQAGPAVRRREGPLPLQDPARRSSST